MFFCHTEVSVCLTIVRKEKHIVCVSQVLELLVQRDREFQELMEVAQHQGKVHQEMQLLEKEVEKRDSDIQQLQKQLKEAEHILVSGGWLDFVVTDQLLRTM